MRFTKMHGAGNDYVYVDARRMDKDWPALSVAMSDRHTGIGADGLILAMESNTANFRMRMFNSDGSEGAMCGNGLRCLVSFAFNNGVISPDTSPVVVETMSGDLEVVPKWDGAEVVWARVGMGEPSVAVEDIPVAVENQSMLMDHPLCVEGTTFMINAVSMGNPHAVAFIDTPVDDVELDKIGPLVEHHPLFPKRINFEIVNVLDDNHVKARVWERGSGLTEACGTGACAIGVIGRLKRHTKSDLTVSLPGGDLIVQWPGHGQVFLEGPVAKVFEGDWPEN